MLQVGVCLAPEAIQVEERRLRPVEPGEALIRVSYCGVCPSDVRVYSGLSESTTFPTVLGHECSGIVEEVGEGVSTVKPGDRVVVDATRRCGYCRTCRRNFENACEHAADFGGCFAQYTRATEENVYVLRRETSIEAAAFAEPLACVVRGQSRAKVSPGERVIIVGGGPIGLLHLLVTKASGARVVVSEPLPERREVALRLGADSVYDPTPRINRTGNSAESSGIRHLGGPFDVAIVAVGNGRAAEDALTLLGHGGRLLLFAGVYPKQPITIDPNLVHYKEIEIVGSFDCTRSDFSRALALIEDDVVDPLPTISHRYHLTELRSAFETVSKTRGLKVMVKM